jgi:hypothetical protein
MLKNHHAHAEMRWGTRAINLYFYEKLSGNKIAVSSNLIFETVDEFDAIPMDSIVLPVEVAQELMDSLWQCGLRPSEGTGSAGALKATENHLKDLQELSKRLLSLVEVERKGQK